MFDISQFSQLQFLDDPDASKTKVKNAMHELQALGVYLLDLNKKRLKTLPLSDTLREAIVDYHNMPSHGAKLRQRQYIGKVMRNEDYLAIAEALDAESLQSQYQVKPSHSWFLKLLDDAQALNTFAEEYTIADFQQFRQLLRNAQKEWKTANATGGKHCQKLKILVNTTVDSNG